jgi:hypothetical protein
MLLKRIKQCAQEKAMHAKCIIPLFESLENNHASKRHPACVVSGF